MNELKNRVLVTHALIYANGPVHIGNMLEATCYVSVNCEVLHEYVFLRAMSRLCYWIAGAGESPVRKLLADSPIHKLPDGSLSGIVDRSEFDVALVVLH